MAKVKVRVGISVDPKGNWYACGWPEASDKEMCEIAMDSTGPGDAHYILTAELEIPAVREVEAGVEEQG